MGFASAVTQLGHAIVPPTLLAVQNATGRTLIHDPSVGRTIAAGLEIVALLTVTIVAARRNRPLARLALVTIVVIAAGLVNGANVPVGLEADRASEFRWWWTAAFLTWTTLGWAIATLVPWRPRALVRGAGFSFAFAIAVTALVGATIFTSGADDVPRESTAYALERTTDRLVLPQIDRDHPVAIVFRGGNAALSVADHLVFRLVQEGVAVQLSPTSARAFGSYRDFDPATHPSAIVIVSGSDALPPTPGRVVEGVVFDREYQRRVRQLVAAVDAQPFSIATAAVVAATPTRRDSPPT